MDEPRREIADWDDDEGTPGIFFGIGWMLYGFVLGCGLGMLLMANSQ